MIRIRQHILVRILCGLVASAILNLSVDAPDMHDDTMSEDLTYNDIESVVEWVLEDVCQIENAIPEHDDNDQQNGVFKLDIKFVFLDPIAISLSVEPFSDSQRIFGDPDFYSQTAFQELTQPPEA